VFSCVRNKVCGKLNIIYAMLIQGDYIFGPEERDIIGRDNLVLWVDLCLLTGGRDRGAV